MPVFLCLFKLNEMSILDSINIQDLIGLEYRLNDLVFSGSNRPE